MADPAAVLAPASAAVAAISPPADSPGEDEEWGGALTEREILALTALDVGDEPPDDGAYWDRLPEFGDPAFWDPEFWDPEFRILGAAGGPAVPEALPGVMPRGVSTDGGFGASGVADTIPPGPVLAGLAADKWAAGLARATDDELAGLMIAWRRMASWASAGELAAVAELERRRRAQVAAGADPHLSEHVADEVALVLTLTSWSADKLVDTAASLARLPKTMAALAAGDIDMPKALVIVGELAGLAGPHASRVEAAVIDRAHGQTTGELRRALRRAVIAADPSAARVRKEKALRQARVERWVEDAGTAALAGRDLPPADVLAADAHLAAWARRLKAAGVDGTMDQLRAAVYLALLNGQPPESLLPAQPGAGGGRREATDGPVDDLGNPASGGPGQPPRQTETAVRGNVNLVVPLATWLGWSAAPGEVAGFGPLDAADSRALAGRLADDPGTRWCLTITGPGGRAAAHGCARHGPGPPLAGDARGLGGKAGDADAGGMGGAGGAWAGREPGPPAAGGTMPGQGLAPPAGMRGWLARFTLAWLESGPCSHQRQSPGYRPSRSLTHLLQIRQRTCTAPGCRRPAAACDFEHTIPWVLGGRTCECNGGPCCRRHHRAKQAAGWQLEQPRPGVFRWTTPLGRRYTTGPDPYPC